MELPHHEDYPIVNLFEPDSIQDLFSDIFVDNGLNQNIQESAINLSQKEKNRIRKQNYMKKLKEDPEKLQNFYKKRREYYKKRYRKLRENPNYFEREAIRKRKLYNRKKKDPEWLKKHRKQALDYYHKNKM